MARTTAATREISILMAEDIAGARELAQLAMSSIGEENDVRLQVFSAELLDFFLKARFPDENETPLMPDMIVASYSQPFRDLKIIAEIRKNDRFREIPIIVVVNENIEKTRAKFVEYGVTEVWSRPEQAGHLKELISGYILRLVRAA